MYDSQKKNNPSGNRYLIRHSRFHWFHKQPPGTELKMQRVSIGTPREPLRHWYHLPEPVAEGVRGLGVDSEGGMHCYTGLPTALVSTQAQTLPSAS